MKCTRSRVLFWLKCMMRYFFLALFLGAQFSAAVLIFYSSVQAVPLSGRAAETPKRRELKCKKKKNCVTRCSLNNGEWVSNASERAQAVCLAAADHKRRSSGSCVRVSETKSGWLFLEAKKSGIKTQWSTLAKRPDKSSRNFYGYLFDFCAHAHPLSGRAKVFILPAAPQW